ncbi:MAG: beta-phosphoglucomutase family hydrolase [Planctomycetes bacterium]|nr:beta-phosphoglucomutase family hydrolase [Planctomycetota bacterium]
MLDWHAADALLFDLDGVLTDTAALHAEAWKRTFDEFLLQRSAARGETFRPFDPDVDYRTFVDGKRRYDGVRDFLRSRGIELPEGNPGDSPDHATVCGVGNRKNALVGAAIDAGRVRVFAGSVEFLRQARARGIRTALVSSSANAAAVLRAAGLEDAFDVRIDGVVAAERRLAGKPAPDTFLAATRELGVEPKRAVVIEDAISGVAAGAAGGFGLVIGVARHDDPQQLFDAGADVVVGDLAELLTGP